MLTSETSAVNGYNLEQLKYVMKMVTRHSQKEPSKQRKSVGERRTICACIYRLVHVVGEVGISNTAICI